VEVSEAAEGEGDGEGERDRLGQELRVLATSKDILNNGKVQSDLGKDYKIKEI
jgi:hypothetical protein